MAPRVRVALHTGEAEQRGGDYVGATLNIAAQLRGLADGGQIFLSGTTAALVAAGLRADTTLVDLGPHRLLGRHTAEQVFAAVGARRRRATAGDGVPVSGPARVRARGRRPLLRARRGGRRPRRSGCDRSRSSRVVGASGSGKSSVLRAGLVAGVGRCDRDHARCRARTGARRRRSPGGRPVRGGVHAAATTPIGVSVPRLVGRTDGPGRGRACGPTSTAGAPSTPAFARRAGRQPGPARPDERRRAAPGHHRTGRGGRAADRARPRRRARRGGQRGTGRAAAAVARAARHVGAPGRPHADLRGLPRDGRRASGHRHDRRAGVRRPRPRRAGAGPAHVPRPPEPGEGTEDTRRRATLAELTPAGGGARIATAARRDGGRPARDRGRASASRSPTRRCIREWPRLRAWLDEDRDGRRHSAT